MKNSNAQPGVGSVISGYRLVGVLGVGGSGTVYLAEQLDGTAVALKLLNAEHAHDDGERQRLAREAEVVRRLAHPHVVSLLDYGFAGDLPFLVFPFLEGRTLEQRIAAEGKVGWSLTGRFSEQALSALEVAHGLGIAHRDIKPANIFCTPTDGGESIRILDFGTAKIVGRKADARDNVTRAGMLIGTPRYMAPEQARGEELTPAADVYAFGLVMVEMLLGRPLVTGAAELDIYVVQGSDRPHDLPDEIRSSPFASVIERAIAKPLEVRYRLASQMLADVRAILARFGEGAGPKPLEADLEATRFLGIAEPVIVPENAIKLRKAFNAMANKVQAATQAQAPAAPPAASPAATAARPPRSSTPALTHSTPAPVLEAQPLETRPSYVPPASAPIASAPIAHAIPLPSLPASGPAPHVAPAPLFGLAPSAAPPFGLAPSAAPPFGVAPSAAPAPTPTSVAARPARTSSSTPIILLSALLAGAVAAGGVAYAVRNAADRSSSDVASSADSGAMSAADPSAAAASASVSAVADGPPMTAPPGAFTTEPIDSAPLERFLAKKGAKQTPELYELALEQMAGCELDADGAPTCEAFADYEATMKRSIKKSDVAKRLEIAANHLRHASPAVRLLAARTLAASRASDLDALIAAAKIEPVSAVLAEMIKAMPHDRPDVALLETKALDDPRSPLVRAAACDALGKKPASAPLESIARAAGSDADLTVRTQCFAALTSLWVRTTPAEPRKDAYDATLSILEAKPRDAAHLPQALGRLAEAKTKIASDDPDGALWLKKANAFYDKKRLADDLEDLALDASMPVSLRGAAWKAAGSIDGKDRKKSVKKKLEALTDADSQALVADPKKTDKK